MDVVYVHKHGKSDDELRYSLRSLKNMPHDNVYICGDLPEWASENIIHIPDRKYDWSIMGNKFANQEAKWFTVCNDPRVSDNFIMMNDDFFVMKPIDSMPTLHRGRLHRAGSSDSHYYRTLAYTREFLIRNLVLAPLNYELHIPMVINKTKRLAVSYFIHRHFVRGQIVQMRSIYGNMFDIGGKLSEDVKNVDNYDSVFLSTDEDTFPGDIGIHIRNTFPEKSKYEL